jgi:hypothetical protein
MKTSGTEDPVMNPRNYAHLIFDKRHQKYTMEKIQPVQQILLGKLDICLQKIETSLSLCVSINSKWIKDLNIRPETLMLVQEKAGNTLEATGTGNDFLNRTQMAQQLREKIDK